MNALAAKLLNRSRRILGNGVFRDSDGEVLPIQYRGDAAAELIHDTILSEEPCMIARMGRTELQTIRRLWFGKDRGFVGKALGYVSGRHGPFWWDQAHLDRILDLSGVFPNDSASIAAFSRRYFQDMPLVDIVGAWCEGETDLSGLLGAAKVVDIGDLEPFFQAKPWTRALEGRKVLVIHPFARSIESQYAKRSLLFANPDILPEFQLMTIPAVQSLGGGSGQFGSWFEALDSMCERMGELDFDVALIGAGAYGLPLAAHAKRLGKQAVHVGGALQLFFGLRGKRWDERPEYCGLYNEHWIRPMGTETPATSGKVEGGCYW